MNQNILILGAGGFIGKHLVNHFVRTGATVTAAVRKPLNFDNPLVRVIVRPFDTFEDFSDLLNDTSVAIHSASTTTPAATSSQPQIEGNLRTLLALLEAMQDKPPAHLIFFSSGGTLYGHCDTPAKESDELHPRSYHGAGKIAAEYFIRAWSEQFNGQATILRPSNIYGPGQLGTAGFGVIPAVLSAAMNSQRFTIFGDGTAERDFLYIDDFVQLVELVAKIDRGSGTNIYNAGSQTATSLNEVLLLIEKITEQNIERRWQPSRGIDISRTFLDISKARKTFAWNPIVPLQSGLSKTWQWMKHIKTEL
ncbi:MAG: NAD-dependent epimerase/dehydratase family protein [Azonexus sp.]|nr:NAD-dependent epimerase/dehydratase family protein [Azonexus sp.]